MHNAVGKSTGFNGTSVFNKDVFQSMVVFFAMPRQQALICKINLGIARLEVYHNAFYLARESQFDGDQLCNEPLQSYLYDQPASSRF